MFNVMLRVHVAIRVRPPAFSVAPGSLVGGSKFGNSSDRLVAGDREVEIIFPTGAGKLAFLHSVQTSSDVPPASV